jgi:hypothetical protein
MIPDTSRPVNVSPRSPRAIPLTYSQYWTTNGSSRWYRSVIARCVLSEIWCWPASRRIGSPGSANAMA